jgi:hypothetical protein
MPDGNNMSENFVDWQLELLARIDAAQTLTQTMIDAPDTRDSLINLTNLSDGLLRLKAQVRNGSLPPPDGLISLGLTRYVSAWVADLNGPLHHSVSEIERHYRLGAKADTYDASFIQVIPKPETLYALIRQVEERPGFYFEAESISALDHFLSGYLQACLMKNIEQSDTPPFRNFHEFVRGKTKFIESTCGWRHMILSFNGNDEAKALAMFFALFEEFTSPGTEQTIS